MEPEAVPMFFTRSFGTGEMTSPTFGPLVRLVVVWVRWDDILEIILTPKEWESLDQTVFSRLRTLKEEYYVNLWECSSDLYLVCRFSSFWLEGKCENPFLLLFMTVIPMFPMLFYAKGFISLILRRFEAAKNAQTYQDLIHVQGVSFFAASFLAETSLGSIDLIEGPNHCKTQLFQVSRFRDHLPSGDYPKICCGGL